MKEWLKEINLEPDFSKRITKNVMKRAKKRKITERIAISSLSFFFVAFLIVFINFSPFTGKGSHSDLSFAVLPTEESSNSHPQSAPVLSLDKGRVREGFSLLHRIKRDIINLFKCDLRKVSPLFLS